MAMSKAHPPQHSHKSLPRLSPALTKRTRHHQVLVLFHHHFRRMWHIVRQDRRWRIRERHALVPQCMSFHRIRLLFLFHFLHLNHRILFHLPNVGITAIAPPAGPTQRLRLLLAETTPQPPNRPHTANRSAPTLPGIKVLAQASTHVHLGIDFFLQPRVLERLLRGQS
ncbi:hypothetical protein CPB85DRAFT_1254576 [Mucidula mucida]|nr:hypothetical protein CPB85DRAFT_1254576 [Mucidula mucida]